MQDNPADQDLWVELTGVCKSFGETAALLDLDLQIYSGEFMALLGPSGCGKTTTLRLIAGLDLADRGRICIDGRNVQGMPARQRNVGIVFQNYALFPHKTVFENVAYGLRRRRVPKPELSTRVMDALAMVQLQDYSKRYPSELSGGQQQRVAIARAVVIKPALLLLDEPLSNLDANLRKEMRGELRSLQRATGITTILVTHDQEEALSTADRIAVMYGGKVEQIGTPQEIYRHPASQFVAGFIGRINSLPACLDSADGTSCEVAFGSLKLAAQLGTTDSQPGVEGRLAIRPECIEIAAQGDQLSTGCDTVLHGVVRETLYVGASYECQVDVGEGVALKVLAPSEMGTALSDGVEVAVGWPSRQATFYEW